MAGIDGVGRVGIRNYVAASVTTYPSSLKLFIDAGNPLSYPGTGTTVTDLAGTQNGTLINGTSYSSANGGSFTFDGINDYITFGTNTAIKPTSQGTISIMAKFTSPYTGYLIANNGGTGRNGFAFLQDSMGSGPIRWYIANGSTYQIGSATNQYEGFGVPPQADIWNLFTLTWDGTTIKTYLNGVLKYQTAQSIQVTTSAYPTLLGNYTTSGGYPLKGNISYLKIYDTAITQTQLTSDFNEIKTRYGFTSYTTRTAAFATATGITDATILNALNTFDTGLISNGLDTKMKALYPFVGGTSTTHKYNFMNAQDTDAAFRLQFNGGWVHSSNGVKGNGTNTFANSFLTPINVISNINSTSVSMYLREDNTNSNLSLYSRNSITGNGGIDIWRYNSNTYYSVNSNEISGPANTTKGHYIATRIVSNQMKLIKGGSVISTSNTSVTNLPNYPVVLGGYGDGTSASYIDNTTYSFTHIGDGLTDAEASTFYNLVQALQTSLSRQV
jgi:hypothetical protein